MLPTDETTGGAGAPPDGRCCGWGAAVAVAAALAVLGWWGATRSTLWDRDEPKFARAAHEMAMSGNRLYPTYGGKLRPDKPVLYYWLAAETIGLMGPTELAARFFSPLGGALAALMTYWAGRRLMGPRAGMWAMIACGQTLLSLVECALATVDGELLGLVALSLAPLAASRGRPLGWGGVVMACAGLSLSMLLKGPVGPAVTLMTLGAALWLGRGERPHWRRLAWQHGAAVLVALVVFLAWAVPANTATEGKLLSIGVGRHLVERSVGAIESHGGHFLLYLPYYIPMVAGGFFPWSLYMPAGLWLAWKGRLGGTWGRAVVFGWAAPLFVLMTLVQTKLPHYILPIWPALALAAGGAVAAARRNGWEEEGRAWWRAGFWLFAVVAGGGAALFFSAPWLAPIPGFLWPAWAVGAALAGFLAWVAWRTGWGRKPAPALGVAGWMLAAHAALAGLALPAVEDVKIGPKLAAELRRAAPGADVFCHGFAEPSLVFYLGQPLDQMVEKLETAEAVADWLRAGARGALVAPRSRLERLEQAIGPLGLREVASVKGFNYSEGKWLDVVALTAGR